MNSKCVHNISVDQVCFDCIAETGNEHTRVFDRSQTELALGVESKLGVSPYHDGIPPHARDSETSRAAAQRVIVILAKRQRQYLCFVALRGVHGATDHEVAAGVFMPLSGVCARRNELMKFTPPLIVKTSNARVTPYNVWAAVYVATDAGRKVDLKYEIDNT